MNRAIFMDRDGVINKLLEGGEEKLPESYVTKWEQFEFLPGVKEAIGRIFNETDYYIIVVSNQSGIGRGYVDAVTVSNIFHRMKAELLGIMISEWFYKAHDKVFEDRPLFFYFCPHVRDAGCACRKPSPGMLYKAAIEHEIDLSKSWMVGDSWSDIRAGDAAGITDCVKVGDYSEVEMMERENISCDVYFAHNLAESVDLVLAVDRLDKVILEEAEKHGS